MQVNSAVAALRPWGRRVGLAAHWPSRGGAAEDGALAPGETP